MIATPKLPQRCACGISGSDSRYAHSTRTSYAAWTCVSLLPMNESSFSLSMLCVTLTQGAANPCLLLCVCVCCILFSRVSSEPVGVVDGRLFVTCSHEVVATCSLSLYLLRGRQPFLGGGAQPAHGALPWASCVDETPKPHLKYDTLAVIVMCHMTLRLLRYVPM